MRNASFFLSLLIALLALPAARGTWSIVLIDHATGEIAIGSATCLSNFDLKLGLPVVRPLVGAAAAQALVDSSGNNRKLIWDELGKGTDPAAIIPLLAQQDLSHQSRQYGIVDTQGRSVTFTGANCIQHASGVTGTIGTIAYAIQGNILTGSPVILATQQAVVNAPGGLPEKLMAGMEAARSMGGDGRCSCSPSNPTGCGSPPPNFTKSAHIAFMIDARRGDAEGTCSGATGCANGAYYMSFNLAFQGVSQPDPVIQLKGLFDAWRASLAGVPDAIESVVSISPNPLLNNPAHVAVMTIELRDWQGLPATQIDAVSVMHDPLGSAGSCAIGRVKHVGGNVYQVDLTAGTRIGTDTLAIEVASGAKTIWLMPSAELCIRDERADLNRDGKINQSDLGIVLSDYGCTAGPGNCPGDIDGDGKTDQADLGILLANYGPQCP